MMEDYLSGVPRIESETVYPFPAGVVPRVPQPETMTGTMNIKSDPSNALTVGPKPELFLDRRSSHVNVVPDRRKSDVLEPPAIRVIKKHNHYFKDVSHLQTIDVYRVLGLFNVTDASIAHAIKKLLVAGGRGAGKDIHKDIQESIDSLTRWQEIQRENDGH